MAKKYWALLDIQYEALPEGYKLTLITNTACHLFMRWTTIVPKQHSIPVYRRGIAMHGDKYFCFDVYKDNEQEEAGDTLIHTFLKIAWPVCETRFFYFHGTIDGEASPSTSAIFKLHFKGVDMYVISIAKLGDANLLHDHVKLKEGAGITLTPDLLNNAIEIAGDGAAPTEYEGFGNHYTLTKIPAESLDRPAWNSDEVLLSIKENGHKLLLQSDELITWGNYRRARMMFNAIADRDHASSMNAFFGINKGNPDIYNDLDQAHIGIWLSNDRWYAHWGNGSTYHKEPISAYSTENAHCFRIEMHGAEIWWYVFNALAHHTTTDVRVWDKGWAEHYSAHSLNSTRHGIICQRIKYTCGLHVGPLE